MIGAGDGHLDRNKASETRASSGPGAPREPAFEPVAESQSSHANDAQPRSQAPAPAPKRAGFVGGPRIGETLVEMGELTADQLDKALSQQRRSGDALGEVLVKQGIISEAALVRGLAAVHGIPGIQLRHGLIDAELFTLIGEEEAERLCALPLFRVRDTLTVAMANPHSLPSIDRLRQITGLRIRPVIALEPNIREFIRKYAGGQVDVDEFLAGLAQGDVEVVERERVDDGPATDLDTMVEGSPIVNLVNMALLSAVKDGASDIHIEPERAGTRIRYRIDGKLRDLMRPPSGMHSAVVSRVKVIGRMDIAEKRLPQEGRVKIVAEGRDIDLRVSSIPTLLGEKIVIRILDKSNLKVRLEDLGFRDGPLQTFQRILHQPHGLVLVTGPTGSGKTTTLYSALDLLRNPETNIVTVEDPVEYQLDMVNQIQVNDQIGMGFARALRSILRQDPDIIMVGEIRDEETARVGVQAALTGHGVLATLHTNDSPGAVARLRDMGVESYLLSAALNGAVAQRLARKVCSACETKYYPAEEVLKDAALKDARTTVFRKGTGCQQCHDTGFRGRVGIYEVMEVTPGVRRLIHHGEPTHRIREHMRTEGWMDLRDEGVLLARNGLTSLEEILRVTHCDEDGYAEDAVDPVANGGSEQRRAAA